MSVIMWIVAGIMAFFAIGQFTLGNVLAGLLFAVMAFVLSPPGTARAFPSYKDSRRFRGWMVVGAVIVWFAVVVSQMPDPDATQDATAPEDVIEADEAEPVVVERDLPPDPVVRAAPNAPVETQDPQPAFDPEFPAQARQQASALWAQLKGARYNSQFHQFGFSPAGPFGDWERQRKALYTEWLDYARNGPGVAEDVMLGPAIHYMFTVGMDWTRTAGQGDANTAIMIQDIEAELGR